MARTSKEANPGDVFTYKSIDYEIMATGLLAGELRRKTDDLPVPVVIYKRRDHPLPFVRERKEFLEKFKLLYKNPAIDA